MGWSWGAWVDSWDDEGDHASVFVEVDDLDEAIKATEVAETLVPRRRTFYGMDEAFVRAPRWHPGRPSQDAEEARARK